MSALAISLAAAAGAQAASTVTVAPATQSAANDFPFGTGQFWPPHMGFVYKNVPAFQLKANDTLSFDLSVMNDNDDQLAIALAPTTVNGGDVPTGAFTPIVSNTQTPANPRGNTTTGDFELRYRVEAPFSFPGGGLIIRLSTPGPALAADMTGGGVLENGGNSTDASGFFVQRFWGDPDGVFPWTASGDTIDIAAFRLEIADPPVVTPPQTTKKCKKKKKKRSLASAAKKKCKKKKKK